MPKERNRMSPGQLFKVYRQVERITQQCLSGKGNIQTLTFNNSSIIQKGMTFALGIEVLKYHNIIDKIINSSGLFKTKPSLKKDHGMLRIIVYEALLEKRAEMTRFKSCGQDMKKSIMNYPKYSKSKTHQHDNPEIDLIRYIRINTLKTTKQNVIRKFQELGYSYMSFADALESETFTPQNKFIVEDNHLPDLLALYPSSSHLHDMDMIKSYEIIAHDKSSCFPPFLIHRELAGKLGKSDCLIDACSAPGNKTSYLAALFSKNKIYAFERDTSRFETLSNRMMLSGAKNVECKLDDFLKTDPSDPKFKNVKAIMLDPSCSGSGIGHGSSIQKDRLLRLQQVQLKLLTHCFKFPNVQFISYSTCSVCEEENEKVTEMGLEASNGAFEVAHTFPEWPHRGLESSPIGEHCVRVDPQRDRTNGFFVVCFRRKN
ncbi:hypothetical protein C9374_006056 [Naegleria lovaniensis]|uniref:SAM-dependent MTase RsmB/NOP-type domain-containing protein n=1 Tax=Naegleria lovaniensis TaxID=51637 RepID=A0AA88GNQ3_NAELO|nr:uncharacterized protein C9374_006056 [Naegleria lovaniensis]KAG2381672.1 hypothetical protein C9374_006056 [Naegleria lovaniensis]